MSALVSSRGLSSVAHEGGRVELVAEPWPVTVPDWPAARPASADGDSKTSADWLKQPLPGRPVPAGNRLLPAFPETSLLCFALVSSPGILA